MGVMTAVVGGMLRDVVSNEVPLILHKEVYAIAAVAGAAVYCGASLLDLGDTVALLAGGGIAFALRAAGIKYNLSLPVRPARERQD